MTPWGIVRDRAIAYAISKGVTIVAAAGNDNVDLGHLSGMHDISSPNNGNPIARKISNVRARCCGSLFVCPCGLCSH